MTSSLLGGILIGVASLIATAASGKIPGISGICGRLLRAPKGDSAWRLLFIVGLIAGGAIAFATSDAAAVYRPMRPIGAVILAGLLVGLGTRIGGGCTSGHGVCGIGLGERDSLFATLIFMAAGMATVSLVKLIPGFVAS